jgi:hypothetical protein
MDWPSCPPTGPGRRHLTPDPTGPWPAQAPSWARPEPHRGGGAARSRRAGSAAARFPPGRPGYHASNGCSAVTAVPMAKSKAQAKPRNRAPRQRTIRDGCPLVSAVPRAAALLAIPEAELARLVDQGGLEVWGRHHDGSPVYRFQQLLELAGAAGLAPTVPGKADPWRRFRAGRKRVNAFGQEFA